MHLALLSAHSLLELFGGVIVVALISLGGWIILQLLRQQGRLLLRLEAVEAQMATGRTAVQEDGTFGSTLAQGADAVRALVDQAEGMPALQVLPIAALANSNSAEASSSPNSHVDPAVGAHTATVGDAVERGTYALMRKGQSNARLNTQLLLAHVLGVKWQTLDAQCELSLAQEQEFLRLLERCGDDEPLDYLVGHTEFYGLDFLVDKRVLIPRAETARLAEAAISAVKHMLHAGRTPLVAEVGTGSGAIAITLAVEEPRLAYLYATDISADALEVASLNCQRHHVERRIRLLHGDLLAPLPEPVDILIANLPYLGTNELDMVAPVVRENEPHLALFGGLNGLELLQRFFVEAQQLMALRDKAVVLVEIDCRHREMLNARLHEIWPQATVSFSKDCFGVDRVLQVYL